MFIVKFHSLMKPCVRMEVHTLLMLEFSEKTMEHVKGLMLTPVCVQVASMDPHVSKIYLSGIMV